MANVAVAPPVLAEEFAQLAPERWPLARRIFFRFLACYFILYSLPSRGRISIVYVIPGASFLAQKWNNLWQAMCPWVGAHWFHLSGRPITYAPTGSGDTTLDFLQQLLYVLFALAFAAIWSAIDYKRPNYRAAEAWLRLLVRYTLAFTLFGYGFVKVFPLQFRPPGFLRLAEPYGDFSPMGALWWFMGASIPYIMFSGASEVLGGLLLLFRRTATLGSLVSFVVMLNVATLNYCYDVPVKLYSTNLVLMAVYLAAPDMRRLIDFFVRNRATAPADLTAPRFSRKWARVAAVVFQLAFVGYQLFGDIQGGYQGYQRSYVTPIRPPIYGMYEVETFTRNGQDVPPLITDGTRWRKFIAEFTGNVNVKMMNDSVRGYSAEYDAHRNIVNLSMFNDSSKTKYPFTYMRPDASHMTFEGTLGNDRLTVKMRRIDASSFLLLNRGFHWINELPLNR